MLVQAQSLSLFYNPDPTTLPEDFDDITMIDNMPLMPYTTAVRTASTAQILQPTPTPTPSMFVGDSSGSGDVGDLGPTDSTTFTSPLMPTATQQPDADVIITLRLSFHVQLSGNMLEQFRGNLSDVVREILELSIEPEVTQRSDDTFNVLIVTTSSQNEDVSRGNLSAITAKLNSAAAARLYGVAVSIL